MKDRHMKSAIFSFLFIFEIVTNYVSPFPKGLPYIPIHFLSDLFPLFSLIIIECIYVFIHTCIFQNITFWGH